MAISYTSLAASVPNWQPVTSSTPTGVSTVTFSGLSGYSKYRIKAPNLICTTGFANFQLRINGDSGANYAMDSMVYSSSTPLGFISNGASQFYIGGANTSTNGVITVDIENALLSNPKQITYTAAGNAQVLFGTGMYFGAAAPITSLTVFLSSYNFYAGTIYIEGAN
jgi:hypothetical protein